MIDNLMNKIFEWVIGIIGSMIYSNYKTMCVNIYNITKLIEDDVTYDLHNWNIGIFNFISEISSNYLLPIGILMVTFVMCYELVTMVINGNNFRDFDTSVFFRWFFKMFIAIFLLDHAFEIVAAIFEFSASIAADINSYIQAQAAGGILGNLGDFAQTYVVNEESFENKFNTMISVYTVSNSGGIILLLIVSILSSLVSMLFIPCVTLVATSRCLYSYAYMAFAPITFATLGSRELGQVGKNYIKNIIALGLQAVLIVIILGLYFGAVQTLMVSVLGLEDLPADVFQNSLIQILLISILICFMLFKTQSIAKSICSAS